MSDPAGWTNDPEGEKSSGLLNERTTTVDGRQNIQANEPQADGMPAVQKCRLFEHTYLYY